MPGVRRGQRKLLGSLKAAGMISKDDAIAAIGYDGNSALVDRLVKRQCAGMTTAQLAEAGLYRAAAASALYSGSAEELALVAAVYNKAAGATYPVEAIPKLFGVTKPTLSKTLSL